MDNIVQNDSQDLWWTFGHGGEYTVSPRLNIPENMIPYGRLWISIPSTNYLNCVRTVFTLEDTDSVTNILNNLGFNSVLFTTDEYQITVNNIIVKPNESINNIVRTYNHSNEILRIKINKI